MNKYQLEFNDWKARIARNQRCRHILVGNVFFYILLFEAFMLGSAFFGLNVETYLAVDIVFYIFPIGAVSGMALLGAFNLFAYMTE